MKCVTLSGTTKDENWLHTKSNKWHIFESTKSLTRNTINDKVSVLLFTCRRDYVVIPKLVVVVSSVIIIITIIV